LKSITFITLHFAIRNLKLVGKKFVSWFPDVIEHQKWENTNISYKVIGHGIGMVKKM
jgi:hypothetical protein